MANKSIQQKAKILEQFINHKINWMSASKKLGISRSTLYEWRKRYIDEGTEGLESKSRRPHTSPNTTSEEVKNEVINFVKTKRTYTSCAEISRYLRTLGYSVSDKTVSKILKEKDLKIYRKGKSGSKVPRKIIGRKKPRKN